MPTTEQPARETFVVGVDLTASGHAALDEAFRRSHDAVVHVVFAMDQAGDGTFADGLPRAEQALAEGRRRLQEHLDSAQALEILGRGVIAHVRLDAPVDAILQLAVDVDADLILVGTEKREGLNAALHKSVGMAVAASAHCPVVVVRPKNYRDLTHTPKILPPCAACLATRAETANATFWCPRHATERGFARHTYGYSRELSLRSRPVGRGEGLGAGRRQAQLPR